MPHTPDLDALTAAIARLQYIYKYGFGSAAGNSHGAPSPGVVAFRLR